MLETLLQPQDKIERCGLGLKDGTIVEIDNVAKDPEIGYEMNYDQVLPYILDDKVAFTWHTHPDSDPNLSGEDYKGFLGWPELEHIIIGKTGIKRYKVDNGMIVECS